MEASSPAGFTVPPAEPFDAQLQQLADNLPGGLALPAVDDPVKARDQFRRITVALREQLPPADLDRVEDITVPGATGELKARVYWPHPGDTGGTLLFVHGGGFVVGDIESYELQVRTIAERTGMPTISVEYRLAPENPGPDAADDVFSIAQWALANAGDFGGNPDKVIIAGDSAGGNLAAVAAQRVPGLAGQVLIYPTTDFSHDYPSVEQHADGPVLTAVAGELFMKAYVGDSDPADPLLSPLLFEDFAAQPPAVVVTTEYDILRDQGLAYAARLAESGVPVQHFHHPSLMHGFMGCFPFSDACDKALTQLCEAAKSLV